MSFQTIALAEGGVVVGYNGLETSGTVLDDFSANNLDATLSTRGALNGSPIITGTARAITASGNAGSGAVATRAVTGGSPLQLSTTFTVCGFFQSSAATPPSVGGMLGERANNWMSRRTSTRFHTLFPYIGGVLQTSLTGTTAMASGERFLIWFRAHPDGWWDLGTNDAVEDARYYGGTVTATTDALSIGTSSNNAFDGLMFPYAIFDHAVDLGVFRAMVREDPTMDYGAVNGIGSVLFDFAGDRNTRVASTSEDATCHGMHCGGRVRAGETRVTDSAGRVYHLGCRTSNNRTALGQVISSTSQADYARTLDRGTRQLIGMWAKRANTSKVPYWDGTKWREAANADGSTWHNEVGVGCAAAALARFLRTGPGDPLMKVAYQCVEKGMAQDFYNTPAGKSWWDNADFSLPHVGKMLLCLQGRMDPGQWEDWKDQFLLGADRYLYTGGPIINTGGTRGPGAGYAAPWYINGNRELGALEISWLSWYLDPTTTRRTRYESQRSWVASPTAGSWQPGGSGSGLTFGLITLSAPAQEDGRDGSGYFKENHGGATNKGFWNIGGAVEGDADYETVNVNGLDWAYSVTQMERATTLLCMTDEVIYARWGNMLMNKTLERLNLTTGVYDGSFGSRHCAPFSWQQSTGLVHKWRGYGLHASLTDTVLATLHNVTLAQCRAHGRAPTQATGRDMTGSNLTALLMGLDAWPGH